MMINLHNAINEEAIRTRIIISVVFLKWVRHTVLALSTWAFEDRAVAVNTVLDTLLSGFMSTVTFHETATGSPHVLHDDDISRPALRPRPPPRGQGLKRRAQ
jgi:hypothetical protein